MASHIRSPRNLSISLLANFRVSSVLFILLLATFTHAQTFQSPATGYSSIRIGGAPGTAIFNGNLYIAFRSNDSSNTLFITSSSDGLNFAPATYYPNVQLYGSPALTVYKGLLYLAYRDLYDQNLQLMYSSDGVNFSTPYAVASVGGNFQSGTSPALTAFNGLLYIAYVDAYTSYPSFASSADGVTFSGSASTSTYTTASPPALAVFNNQLVSAIQAPNHMLVLDVSTDGISFGAHYPYPNILMGTSPSLAVYNLSKLVVTFQSNDQYHLLFQATGYDAATMANPATGYAGIKIGDATAMAFGGLSGAPSYLYCAFQSDDSYHVLFITKSP